MKSWKWIVGGVGGVALVLASRPGLDAQAVPTPSAPVAPALAPVRVETLQLEQARSELLANGVIEARQTVVLSFLEGGRVASRAVDIGDRVERGQILARLDARALANGVQAAQATVEELTERTDQLERDARRSEQLTRAGVTTDVELEQTRSGLARTEAMARSAAVQLRESQRRRSESVLRAPFAGTITDVFVEAGELVAPGTRAMRLVDADGLEVILQVPTTTAEGLVVGQELRGVATAAGGADPREGREVVGEVLSVSARAAGLNRLHPVRIAVRGQLAAGLGVQMRLLEPVRDGLSVPLAAVVDPSGTRPSVWRLEQNEVERVVIRLGAIREGRVEVREGLAAGDTIVVEGQEHLLPGDAVDVIVARAPAAHPVVR